MDTLSSDIGDGLKKELECPVCFNYMKPPIIMCENGHNICRNCKPKLRECPSCRKPFLDIRNLSLESFSNALFACKLLQETKKVCITCPFLKLCEESCSWEGGFEEMKVHILNVHNSVKDLHRSEAKFTTVLSGLSPKCNYRKALLIAGEMFFVVWEIKDGDYYCALLCIAPRKTSSKFRYKFSLSSGKKGISMTLPAKSIVTEKMHFFVPGECIFLHYLTVIAFLNSDKELICNFEIMFPELEDNKTEKNVNQSKSLSQKTSYSRQNTSDSNSSDNFLSEKDFTDPRFYPKKREFLDPNQSDNATGRVRRLPPKLGRAGRRPRGSRTSDVFNPHAGNLTTKFGKSLCDLRDLSLFGFDTVKDVFESSVETSSASKRDEKSAFSTSSSKEINSDNSSRKINDKYWKCTSCGKVAPLNNPIYSQFKPPGFNYRCVECGEWRV